MFHDRFDCGESCLNRSHVVSQEVIFVENGSDINSFFFLFFLLCHNTSFLVPVDFDLWLGKLRLLGYSGKSQSCLRWILVSNIDKICSELRTVEELEGDNLAKSCEDSPNDILLSTKLFRNPSNVKVVHAIRSTWLASFQGLGLLSNRLLDDLLFWRFYLKLHVANLHSI